MGISFMAPKNGNYAATVVRVRHINVLANCDNVVGVPLLGYQAIVSKDVQVGDLGLLFTAETQLAAWYAYANNLHRHENLNFDPSKKGYLEDNRRVKALKFRGHRSDALFMPLDSLAYIGVDTSQLREGDTFDQLDGNEVCRKYLARLPRVQQEGVGQGRRRREERVDEALFPKHFDTANYFRNPDVFADAEHVVITQKLHGTSIRIGHVPVKRKLTLRDRVARFFGATVRETEYAYVYGSRNVVKDPENPLAPTEFYGSDLYTEIGSQLKGLLPKGWIIYGEIVGWVPGTETPIQKGYTYRIPAGIAELYAYRVAVVGEDGRSVDLSWPAVRQFCESIGLATVPELEAAWGGRVAEGWVADNFLDRRFADHGYYNALPTDGSTVDEGVCLRVEGLTPRVVKAKSPEFLRHETKMIDREVEDLEAAA